MYGTRVPTVYRAADASRYSSSIADFPEAAARAFYEDVLGGVEVGSSQRVQGEYALYFLIEDQVIEVCSPCDEVHDTLELMVASPIDLAERCWDAGCTVRLESDGDVLRVTDPLGRTLVLRPRARVGD